MLKSSRKALSIARASSKLEIPNELLSEKEQLVKPEEKFQDDALANIHYRTLVTLSLGKNLVDRVTLTKTEVERFTLLYSTDPKNVKSTTYLGIIPLKRRGYSWESSQSRSLRRRYTRSADEMFERLDLCDFSDDHFSSGSIELVNVPYKTVDYLEFSSAAALVDRRPHKRKNHNSGDAVYFRDFYLKGKRGILFAVFDALSDSSKSDHKVAAMLVSHFKKFFDPNTLSVDESTIFSTLAAFLNYAEEAISKLKSHSGASMSIGLVYSGFLYYLNIGDCRVYTISFYPDLEVKKITIDDGMAGLVERGARVSKKEFFSQLKSPEYFVGGFSQSLGRVKGRRVLHSKINQVYPNIGKVSLENVDFVLVSTDGFWSNLPISTRNNLVSDASGEYTIGSLISNSSAKNPRQILESLYGYSRSNMKLKRTVSDRKTIIKPRPQDIGLLGFSI